MALGNGPTPTRPTLEAVADRAGVSRGTVSRVINDSPRVSEQARRVVLAAIEELGYVPNHAARTLVTRRTDTVALVVSESEERVFTEPFFAGIVRGTGTELSAAGMQLLLAITNTPDDRRRLERYLTGQHVDGVLMLSMHAEDDLPRAVAARGIPLVLGGRPAGCAISTYVDADNAGGARGAVRHLAGRGCRRIATICGPADMQAGLDRLAGYRAGLDAAGLRYDEDLVAPGDFSGDSGAAAMAELLTRAPDLDAVFAASDPMAVAAIRVLRTHGRSVPDDVAVIGFDDSSIAEHCDPPLTSVHQPLVDMGRQMAQLLIGQRAGMPEPAPVILPTHLSVRESA